MLDINLQVGPQHYEDRWTQQHEPEEGYRPNSRHVYLFTAAQEGAIRAEQGQEAERGSAEERQPNATDLRVGLIDRITDEIR